MKPMRDRSKIVESNLVDIIDALAAQEDVGRQFPPELLQLEPWLEQLREWVCDVNECGIAYESIVATLELYPFSLRGPTAVKLLEVGLLMGFKTDREEDKCFVIRPAS
jgi:hypothetical protein